VTGDALPNASAKSGFMLAVPLPSPERNDRGEGFFRQYIAVLVVEALFCVLLLVFSGAFRS